MNVRILVLACTNKKSGRLRVPYRRFIILHHSEMQDWVPWPANSQYLFGRVPSLIVHLYTSSLHFENLNYLMQEMVGFSVFSDTQNRIVKKFSIS